jgi:cell wall-associated NlpC family hydrolase
MEEDNTCGRYRLRSDGLGWLILSAALTLFLTFSPHPAQAQAGSRGSPSGNETLVQGRMGERYAKSFGVSETPTKQVILPQDGGFLLASLRSPPRPFDGLPRFTLPLKIVSPPLTPRSIRSEPDNLTDRTLTQARYYLGTPYRRGGSLRTGHTTDCSGFVQFIYKKSNIDLPRSSREQARVGMIVAKTLDFAVMRPGDLLFFSHRGHHIGHVGIYLGDGKMIHASSHRRGVIITDLRQSSYQGAFVVAKRLLEAQYPK